MPDTSAPIAVEMRGITKRFPGVLANHKVDFAVRVGEIHALLGENGAGKSTLMSVLCGLYQQDEGKILLAQKRELSPVQIHSPSDAFDLGIGMIHQHFKLIPTQTVAENMILGLKDTPFNLQMTAIENRIRDLADRYRLEVDPRAYIWQLSVGERQRVEILKVLYRGANILILDEPTAVLTPQEADELGAVMRNMASEGKALIFISHKLDEIMAFADRVTVLRSGENVATVEVSNSSKTELAQLMVGRPVLFTIEKPPSQLGDVVVAMEKVSALNDKGLPALDNVSLEIRSGEIVGIAGVAGNGQRELAEVVTGLRPTTTGRITIRNRDMTHQPPYQFIQQGVAHVPGDRLGMGLAGNLPVSDNMIMKSYNREPISSGIFLRNQMIRTFAQNLVKAFQVLTPNLETPARNLSGGNQQKAILAREITAGKNLTKGDEPPFLVTVYPTRGLDVGAIETVRRELLEQRAQGVAILLISEQLDELLALSDRIAVLHGGEIMGIVDAAEADIEHLGLMMAGELHI
ncbi:MAG: ABC transporter ATP-binding protein [Anaerolineae bacterium]|nr:ABC transporter ATP-binding protein [Anaerolineae bacterium]